jgi:N-acetylglucosamine-6-phosphate deacetylase
MAGNLSDIMQENMREARAQRFGAALAAGPQPFAIENARKVDARGIVSDFWLVASDGIIQACGSGDDSATGAAGGSDSATSDFEAACRAYGVARDAVIDAGGKLLTPGYVDLHAHGAWGSSFDDGEEGIEMARAGHLSHGTTRQVLSLITNPLDVIKRNLTTVRSVMKTRPDILGAHLEGPFLALERKGAHDPKCLLDPVPSVVDELLAAADGCLRQITIAPELEHGISAIRQFAAAGVVPAVGHSSADYDTAKKGFEAGATIMTHMFNAMNGMHHRKPGPIPAAVQDPRVTIELINDGFHVQDPMLKMGFGFAPHRIAFITDAMEATDCPDGHYLLGKLDVNVVDGHARLVSNGAIAGSTLVLEKAVQRAVLTLGFSPTDAVEAATLTPARALGFDRPNTVTGAPLGLTAPGYAADVLLSDPSTWHVENVWCAGRRVK